MLASGPPQEAQGPRHHRARRASRNRGCRSCTSSTGSAPRRDPEDRGDRQRYPAGPARPGRCGGTPRPGAVPRAPGGQGHLEPTRSSRSRGRERSTQMPARVVEATMQRSLNSPAGRYAPSSRYFNLRPSVVVTMGSGAQCAHETVGPPRGRRRGSVWLARAPLPAARWNASWRPCRVLCVRSRCSTLPKCSGSTGEPLR